MQINPLRLQKSCANYSDKPTAHDSWDDLARRADAACIVRLAAPARQAHDQESMPPPKKECRFKPNREPDVRPETSPEKPGLARRGASGLLPESPCSVAGARPITEWTAVPDRESTREIKRLPDSGLLGQNRLELRGGLYSSPSTRSQPDSRQWH